MDTEDRIHYLGAVLNLAVKGAIEHPNILTVMAMVEATKAYMRAMTARFKDLNEQNRRLSDALKFQTDETLRALKFASEASGKKQIDDSELN
jgi:hypothetical protein